MHEKVIASQHWQCFIFKHGLMPNNTDEIRGRGTRYLTSVCAEVGSSNNPPPPLNQNPSSNVQLCPPA
jgi:hypothetical protein